MLPAAEPARGDPSRAAQLLAGLDPAQVAAVTTPSTVVAVIAGAGSGKTRVLTTRIAHRIAIGAADARHTLALTFTARRPVSCAAGSGAAGCATTSRRARSTPSPSTSCASVGPTSTGVRRRSSATGSGCSARSPAACRWPRWRRRPTGPRPGAWRPTVTSPPPGRPDAAARRRPTASPTALAAYETLKRRRGVVDLDDLLTIAARELVRDPAWADAVRFRYRHVVVDEAQDLNPVQHRILDLIVGGRDDLYLVGDPAQAIYGFNGSDPGLLRDIAARLPGVEVIHLPTNHRSTPQIVAAGAAVLQAGGQPAVAMAVRGDGEAVRILGGGRRGPRGGARRHVRCAPLDPVAVRAGTVAVLARTNAQLRRLASALTAAGVPVMRRQLAPGSPLAAVVRAVTALPSASRLRGWAHDVLEDDDAPPAIPSRAPSARSPRRCSSSCATSRSATERRCVPGSRRRTRSPTASAVSRSSRSTPPRDGSGRPSW